MTSRTGVDAPRSQPDGGSGGPAADRPDGPRCRRLALDDVPAAVTVGRHFTRQALADWHWIPEPPDPTRQTVAADVLLVVSELIANATLHAGGPKELAVAVDSGARSLRLEVVDSSLAMPVASMPQHPGLPGGRGLYIVDRLCDRWGVIAGDEGKTVWAEIDVTRLDADLNPPPPVNAGSAPAAQE